MRQNCLNDFNNFIFIFLKKGSFLERVGIGHSAPPQLSHGILPFILFFIYHFCLFIILKYSILFHFKLYSISYTQKKQTFDKIYTKAIVKMSSEEHSYTKTGSWF